MDLAGNKEGRTGTIAAPVHEKENLCQKGLCLCLIMNIPEFREGIVMGI